jgi:peptidoglycan hydrolase CwlO-like protein
MAEVTKKDLQSLQGYCNKQIADVHKEVAEVKSQIADVKKQFASIQVEIKDVRSLIDKRYQTLVDMHNTLQGSMVSSCNELDRKLSQVASALSR